jgi:carbon-monoxide dehydrogenase medium subunit
MIPQSFEYLAPRTLPEAISYLQQYGDDAKILSGGHSLIPMMKLRLTMLSHIVDINGIPGMEYIKEEDGFLKIGALTREAELEGSDLIRKKYPIILDTAKMIADPQVRNMATVGGNLAHGDPANDHPATMLALNARVVATGATGKRTIPIDNFFVSLFETALEADEILTEIQIPIPAAGSSGAYLKLERKVGDFATAGVAAQVTLDKNGVCQSAGIGLTNAGPVPVRAAEAENLLTGQKPDDSLIAQAAQLAEDVAEPSEDLRGPVEYKKAMIKELTKRALTLAVKRAKGGQ